jgi:hypothetical protein
MIHSKSIKKQNKITIKYFLRKERSPIVFSLSKTQSDEYYQLYIDFVFKRKTNRCKSSYLAFMRSDSMTYQNAQDKFINRLIGYNVFGVNDKAFTDEVKTNINTVDFLDPTNHESFQDFLIYERHHAKSLFSILREVDDADFIFTNLGEGYRYSILFVYELLEEIIKKKLAENFYVTIPNFPKILNLEENLNNLLLQSTEILSLTNPQFLSKYEDFDSYVHFINKFRAFCYNSILMTYKMSSDRGVTLPVWIAENLFAAFQDTLEREMMAYSENEKVLLKDILTLFEQEIISEKNKIISFFK